MLNLVLTGQAKGFSLLLGALLVYLYFLPSVLGFLRAHRRFWIILLLNILLSPVQGAILHFFFPTLAVVDPNAVISSALVAIVANLGPGWLALLVWSLASTEPNPKLVRARNTKLYDAVAALPLILWFVYGAWQVRPTLVNDIGLIRSGAGDLYTWAQLFSLSAAAAFDLLLVYMLLVRDKPVLKSKGVLPRVFGFIGTFAGVGILQLPVAALGHGMQIVAAILVGVGSLGSFFVLWRLGKSFSIMPEARTLVTGGPYAHVRHPLYGVEMITIIGTAVQFAQPWAALIAVLVVALLVVRSHYEEGVLEAAYPEYAAYRAKTKRFIPGVI
jgi:protein-S-isoprenylcysteine O-methyltransferase Ste14